MGEGAPGVGGGGAQARNGNSDGGDDLTCYKHEGKGEGELWGRAAGMQGCIVGWEGEFVLSKNFNDETYVFG